MPLCWILVPPCAVKVVFDFTRAHFFGMCDWLLMFFWNFKQYSLIGKMLPQVPVLILAVSCVPVCFCWGNSVSTVANIDSCDECRINIMNPSNLF